MPDLDLIVPLAANPAHERGDHGLLVFGALKPGVSLQQASADMRAIAAQLSAQYPDSNGGWSVLLRSFYDWLVPADTRRMLLVFLVAVGGVLLIASSNVANLMLARAAARQKEMSIRVALGAGRGRVLSQLLVESVLLALIAGAVGCALAVGATELLKGFGADAVPRVDEVAVDGRVLLFAVAVSIATGIFFGLVPALQASRPNMNESLKDAGRSGAGGGSRQRLRDALVIVEVALSVALLVGAGLLIRSMWTLQQVDPGFDPQQPADDAGERDRRLVSIRRTAKRVLPARAGDDSRAAGRDDGGKLEHRADGRRQHIDSGRDRGTCRGCRRRPAVRRLACRERRVLPHARRFACAAAISTIATSKAVRPRSSARRWRAATGRTSTRSAGASLWYSAKGPRITSSVSRAT